MTPNLPLDWVSALRYEEEGTGKARPGLDDLFEANLAGGPRPTEAPAGTGGWLMRRRPRPLRIRYRTVALTERAYQECLDEPDLEFGILIAGASSVLERELDLLLVGPAYPLAGRLQGLLAEAGEAGAAAGLRWWADRRGVATLGTSCLVLLALRRGLGKRDGDVEAFLAETFQPDFRALLADKQPLQALNALRDDRNAACHGQWPNGDPASFSFADYQEFACLAVGRQGFAEWEQQGPARPTPPGSAFLHHLLSGSRLVPAELPLE